MRQETLSIFVYESFEVNPPKETQEYVVTESVPVLTEVVSFFQLLLQSMSVSPRAPSFFHSFIAQRTTVA